MTLICGLAVICNNSNKNKFTNTINSYLNRSSQSAKQKIEPQNTIKACS